MTVWNLVVSVFLGAWLAGSFLYTFGNDSLRKSLRRINRCRMFARWRMFSTKARAPWASISEIQIRSKGEDEWRSAIRIVSPGCWTSLFLNPGSREIDYLEQLFEFVAIRSKESGYDLDETRQVAALFTAVSAKSQEPVAQLRLVRKFGPQRKDAIVWESRVDD